MLGSRNTFLGSWNVSHVERSSLSSLNRAHPCRGALLAYAAIRLFIIPVRYESIFDGYGDPKCPGTGFGGVINALTVNSEWLIEESQCSEEAWNRINSSIIWVCLGGGMLLAGLKVRRDGIEKAESWVVARLVVGAVPSHQQLLALSLTTELN